MKAAGAADLGPGSAAFRHSGSGTDGLPLDSVSGEFRSHAHQLGEFASVLRITWPR
jgi:hypothetical protein